MEATVQGIENQTWQPPNLDTTTKKWAKIEEYFKYLKWFAVKLGKITRNLKYKRKVINIPQLH